MGRGEQIHNERDNQHGHFIDNANATGQIMRTLTALPAWKDMDDIDELTVRMIVHKLSRAAAGNAQFEDHWDDIEGYIIARRKAKKMQAERKLGGE